MPHKIGQLRSFPLTDYLTEQEQIQQLKNWIKQYGLSLLLGILAALAITSGWHYWERQQNKMLMRASHLYDKLITLRSQNNLKEVVILSQKLKNHYTRTPYAQMAALMLAWDATQRKAYHEAEEQCRWVMDHSKERSIRQVARLRLARIQIAQQQPEEALKSLTTVDDNTFIGLVDEVRGDAYLAQHNINAARHAYQLALAEIPNVESTQPILQMKYDNLATRGAV